MVDNKFGQTWRRGRGLRTLPHVPRFSAFNPRLLHLLFLPLEPLPSPLLSLQSSTNLPSSPSLKTYVLSAHASSLQPSPQMASCDSELTSLPRPLSSSEPPSALPCTYFVLQSDFSEITVGVAEAHLLFLSIFLLPVFPKPHPPFLCELAFLFLKTPDVLGLVDGNRRWASGSTSSFPQLTLPLPFLPLHFLRFTSLSFSFNHHLLSTPLPTTSKPPNSKYGRRRERKRSFIPSPGFEGNQQQRCWLPERRKRLP